MKKILIAVLSLLLFSNFAHSQTKVKVLLPDNCAANTTDIETITIEKSAKLLAFPNPSNGNFSVEVNSPKSIGKATITIYSTAGLIVYLETIFCNSNKYIKPLHLTNLKSGVYFINFTFNDNRISSKLIIQ